MGAAYKVICILNLTGHLVPKLNGEVHVGGSESTIETILEGLNGPFSGIDTVIAGFDELELAFLWGAVQFDCLHCLIVHDVDFWCISFADKIFKVLIVRGKYFFRI